MAFASRRLPAKASAVQSSSLSWGRTATTLADRPSTKSQMRAPGADRQQQPQAQQHPGTMPPGYDARVGKLQTFTLPDRTTGSRGDVALGRSMIDAWRRDGILQVTMGPRQRELADAAFACSRGFFARPQAEKAALVDDRSFAGYVASGEEITDGVADYSEIFTVTKDLPATDARVQYRWPCHGPTPWADAHMRSVMTAYTDELGRSGETMLQLIAYGLGLPNGEELTKYTHDGWHHMRILRFPERHNTNGKGKEGRGIGSHTDYGLLVIAAQDHVGGLFIRPPYEGEDIQNWAKSSAGQNEDDNKWVYVPPVAGTFTVFPGDMMQYITNGYLKSTPHKVGLNTAERFAFAYFHEPNFSAVLKPLPGFDAKQEPVDGIHYGTHFTNMAMRNYPDRITAQRVRAEDRMSLLRTPELRWPDSLVTSSATSTYPREGLAQYTAAQAA